MKTYTKLLKNLLRDSIHDFRLRHHYSQEYMAELLYISPRCYIDQEHGKYGFSFHTFVRFLLLLSDKDVLHMLHEFRELLEKEAHDDESA